MSEFHPPAPLRENDYEVIEAAVMETEKGRWFLAEYARRHRAADTVAVLDAIVGLERRLGGERRPDLDRIRLEVGDMKDAIERTKAEIAHVHGDGSAESRFERATSELDSIVVQTEAATSEILGAAEKLQEATFVMRESGADAALCDQVEDLVMSIYTACSFQDLTGQRTQKVVHVLRYLEARIDAMIAIWGLGAEGPDGSVGDASDARPDAHLLNGPPLPGEGIDQAGVDDLMDAPASAEGAVGEVEPPPVGPLPHDLPEVAAFGPAGEPVHPSSRLVDALDGTGRADAPDATGPADTGEVMSGDGLPIGAPDEAGTATDDGISRDLAEASAAMETAIGALREVSVAVSGSKAPVATPQSDQAEDPWRGLSRAERLALFS